MEKREHDLFLDMASNLLVPIETLISAGLTAENTALLNKEDYLKDEWVQELFKDEYGLFDQALFDKFYENAKVCYNALANISYNDAILKQATYHRDNIFAPVELKRKGPEFYEFKTPNPYEVTSSVHELGKTGPRTKSIDEIAQQYEVLLNPTTAGENFENAEWGDSPNDAFFSYVFDTLVLALYGSDGTHTDPITGETVEHKAGDPKLNPDGNFYYEKLDGRDIYGRRVLNKMNVLTVDGSWANQFDPFDSDDLLQKSIGGTIMKNLALVGSMFLPYVGPYITGLSIATLLAGLTGTLGKMLVGSDSPTLSALEGWSKSLSRLNLSTEYALNNTWCWENTINLIGDVAAQLKELRFFFKQVPAIFKGKKAPYTSEEIKKALEALTEKHLKLMSTKIEDLRRVSSGDLIGTTRALMAKASSAALNELKSFIKGYNKIGEITSKGYMTAITVQDTYGEAKKAGASDTEAALLTMGYAAAEYAILNTGIGEWVLPELRASRVRYNAIAKALTTLQNESKLTAWDTAKKAAKTISVKEGKKEYVKKLFNIGKNLARDVYTAEKATGAKTLSATLAASMGESAEEFSEELLADFSKSCFNIVQWLLDDNTRMNAFGYDFKKDEWNTKELFDRYGMSIVGGFVGGGIANLGINYQQIKQFDKINHREAVKELISMTKNGEIDDFMKTVSKSKDLGNPNLAINFELLGDNPVFDPGTKNNNLNLMILRVIKNLVDIIKSILQANGAVSDNKFLDIQTLKDIRFGTLQESTTAGAYLDTYNNLLADIYDLQTSIDLIERNNTSNVTEDNNNNEQRNSIDQQQLVEKRRILKEKTKELKDLLDGKKSLDFISAALLETSPVMTDMLKTYTFFPLYAELKAGKKYEDLTELEKEKYLKDYTVDKTQEGRERIITAAAIYRELAKRFNSTITDNVNLYLETPKELLELSEAINNLYHRVYTGEKTETGQTIEYDFSTITDNELYSRVALNFVEGLEGSVFATIINHLGSELDKKTIEDFVEELRKIHEIQDPNEKADKLKKLTKAYEDFMSEILVNRLTNYIQPYIDRGFANKETKNILISLLEEANRQNNKLNILWYEENLSDEQEDIISPYDQNSIAINDAIERIKNLNSSPIENSYNLIAIAMGLEPINITLLLDIINNYINDSKKDVTTFTLSNTLEQELNNAVSVLGLYKAIITGARTDNANFNNIFGYNATINEVAKKLGLDLNLAEIDKTIADIFLQDIDTTLNKLQFALKLYQANQGLKLTRQDKVATHKDLLIYKNMRRIVSVLDDDELKTWDYFNELTSIIETKMRLHKELSANNRNLDASEREEFEREKILLEDAVYEFFSKNSAKVLDVKELMKFLNPKRFNLYTNADELLDENLDSLDDNSFLWWLASRAAVKASDFYFQYKDIIDGKLAPVATQELAVYLSYAHIVNKQLFENFYNAYRQSVIKDWSSKSIEKKKEILKQLNKDVDFLSQDELTKYALNYLTIPKYKNVVLVEGIPGSGKTDAVVTQVITLLNKYNKDILSNVFFVHGAEATSAAKLQKKLNVPNSKSFGLSNFMKTISSGWTEYSKDEKGNYIINEGFGLNSESELRSKLGINDMNNPPSLIVIDEISKFTAYDLDLIDKFALKYNITVITLGDFDQSGVSGKLSVHKVFTDLNLSGDLFLKLNLDRSQFIRTPKLGVSMRTDNIVKTFNLAQFLLFLKDPNHKLTLLYIENEEGLFGDKVINYNDKERNGKELILGLLIIEIKKLIDTLKQDKDGKVKKIGYIYNDPNSPLYKELSKPEYKPYIDLKPGGSALGLEGQYYIVEVDSSTSLKDIYTGLSRASQGSIIILPKSGEDNNALEKIVSEEKQGLIKENLPEDVIKKYANRRKDLLNKIIENGNPIKVKSITKQEYTEELKNRLIQKIHNASNTEDIDRYISEVNALTNSDQASKDPDVIKAKNERLKELNKPKGLQPGTPPGGAAPLNLFTEELKNNLIKTITDATTVEEILVAVAEADILTDKQASVDPDIINLVNKRILEILKKKQPVQDQEWLARHDSLVELYVDKFTAGDIVNGMKPNGDRLIAEVDLLRPELNADEWFLPGDIVHIHVGLDLVVEKLWDTGEVELSDGTILSPDEVRLFFNKEGGQAENTYVLYNSRLGNAKYLDELTTWVADFERKLNINYTLTANTITLSELFSRLNALDIPSYVAVEDLLKLFRRVLFYDVDSTNYFYTNKNEVAGSLVDPFYLLFNPEDVSYIIAINDALDQAEEIKARLSTMLPHRKVMLLSEVLSYYDELISKGKDDSAHEDNPLDEYDGPTTDTDTMPTDEYLSAVDEANATDPPKNTVQVEDTIHLNMLFHSFNTFELGVLEDLNGMPVPIGQNSEQFRIDSVYGLMNIDSMLGNSIRTVQEYKNIIGKLRNAIFNISDKATLEETLKNILGLPDIYCTFALMSHAEADDPTKLNPDGYFGGMNPFAKSAQEETFGNGSVDRRSKEWHLKTISIIIGTGNKNVLTLPLLALTSPFTIIQLRNENKELIFPELYNDYLDMVEDDKENDFRLFALNMVSKYGSNPKYKEIVDLFNIWTFHDLGVFYINDMQWTPCSALHLEGPQVVTEKGYYQAVSGFEFKDVNRPWVDLADITPGGPLYNPQTHWTLNIYSSIDGTIEGVDGTPIIAGHAFVIVSYDDQYNNDTTIIKRYILEQLNPNLPKKTRLIYVTAPEASIAEYLEKLFLGKQSPKSIGLLFTSYKLLKVLVSDDRFKDLLNRKYPLILPLLLLAIADADEVSKDPDKLKDFMFTMRDWTEIGFGHKPLPLAFLFDDALSKAASIHNTLNSSIGEKNVHKLDDDAIQLITQILADNGITSVRHNFKYLRGSNGEYISNQWFVIPKQGTGKDQYTLDGKKVQIHCKIDSLVFSGNIGSFLDSWVKKIVRGDKYDRSTDTFSFYDFKHKLMGCSKLTPPKVDPKEAERIKTITNIINKVKAETGLDVSSKFSNDVSIEEALSAIVSEINLNTNSIAFTIGNDLYISGNIKGKIYIYSTLIPDTSITNIAPLFDNLGIAYFQISIDGEVKNASYNKNTRELEILENELSGQPVLTVNPENFSEYLKQGREILKDLIDPEDGWDDGLMLVFSKETYEEFMEELNALIPINDNERINDLREIVSKAKNGLQTGVIADIIAIERSKNSNQQCPITVKIKF